MMFGLAAIPFFAMAGMAVDFSRALQAKADLSAALDATALALGTAVTLSPDAAEAQAKAFFKANYRNSTDATASALKVNFTGKTVTIGADATVDTVVMGLIGFNTLTVDSFVEVTREMKAMEVSLVLDTTLSMKGSKLTALKEASHDLIDILFGDDPSPSKLKVGVVPFSDAVRLNLTATDAIQKGWIDTGGKSSVAKQNFSDGYYAYALYPNMPLSPPNSDPVPSALLTGSGTARRPVNRLGVHSNTAWKGCVEARPNGIEATDTVPVSTINTVADSAAADTRWVPYFQPDEPDSGSYSDNYTADVTTSTDLTVRRKFAAKYKDKTPVAVNSGCAMQQILDLTNNKLDIETTIDGLVAAGYTHIPIGLGWGWRLLSPEEPYTKGVPYNTKDTSKVLVLMTDGANTIETGNNSGKSDLKSVYSAYGYLANARMGSGINTTSKAVSSMNSQITTMCTAIKAKGIKIYTILFQEDDTTIKNILKNCATDEAKFFAVDTAPELSNVFRQIGSELSELRVSR